MRKVSEQSFAQLELPLFKPGKACQREQRLVVGTDSLTHWYLILKEYVSELWEAKGLLES